MGKITSKILTVLLMFAISALSAESTQDDSLYTLPPPKVKKTNWRAAAFAGCALIAVVGGVFAICWSGGGNTPQCNSHKHPRSGHNNSNQNPICAIAPTTI